MSRIEVQNDYFEWMFDLINGHSYRELLTYLHSIEFTYRIRSDADRAYDGVNLRHRFALDCDDYDYVRDCLDSPCSVLEMILALAIRCEEIMSDPMVGDRTSQWFWKMIVNLGLGGMTDGRFDEYYTEDMIRTFLKRKYEANGRGGLFTIKNCDYDLRGVDIWTQMMWYLDTMI